MTENDDDLNLRIYFHIATLHNWKEVVTKIFHMIHNSGLLEAVSDINICVLGDQEAVRSLLNHPKIKIRYHSVNTEEYERPILKLLRQDAIEAQANQKPFKALYLHSKGIRYRNQNNPCVTDWVNYLLYFNVEKWPTNVDALNDHQICGVSWREEPKPHYSGNFWWARSDYLAELPAEIGPDYLDPEMWLASNQPKFKCLHYSKVNHYSTPYPESLYKRNS